MIEPKQIDKLCEDYVKVGSFTANGSSDDITSALTSVLSTAGAGGSSVPLQVGSTTTVGINTSGIVEVLRNSNNRNVISNGSNDIVYAKLTFSSGVYTVSYYYTDTNDETEHAYSFPSNTTIDLYIKYFFSFGTKPINSLDSELLIHKINAVYYTSRSIAGF